ncbi:hypothetical protein L218DRAFT_1007811 [Marasmius fiardii PR-910]|nr:hypothetical protein L218DRAFT_1007811 [Marasmius fiardii PR-910]
MSLATALSELLSTTDTEPKSSAVEQKSHVNIEATAQLIEDQIRRKHAEENDSSAPSIPDVKTSTPSIPGPSSNGSETASASAQNNPSSVPVIGQETATASSSNSDFTGTTIPSSTDGDTNMTEASNDTSGSNQ